MYVHLEMDIEAEDLELNAGQFNRKILKIAQNIHSSFMQTAIGLYKERADSVDLETLPSSEKQSWEKSNA